MNKITITLLAIIALVEITRLVLILKNPDKKSHFKGKLLATKKMVWDLEFKTFKTQEIREDIRKEYDFMKSRIDTIDKSIKDFPKKGDQAEKARFEDDKVRAEKDRDRLLAQIKSLDKEINGAAPTMEEPNGASGVKDQIASLKELGVMLKDWIKQL